MVRTLPPDPEDEAEIAAARAPEGDDTEGDEIQGDAIEGDEAEGGLLDPEDVPREDESSEEVIPE
jgi:hypothetical protein